MNVFFSNMSSLKVSANKILFLRSGSWELYHGVKSPLHVVSFRNFLSVEEIENTNFVSNVYPRTLRLKFLKAISNEKMFWHKNLKHLRFRCKMDTFTSAFFQFQYLFLEFEVLWSDLSLCFPAADSISCPFYSWKFLCFFLSFLVKKLKIYNTNPRML